MSATLPDRTLVQVSPRGQLTLPAEVRVALGIEAGDTLVVSIEDGGIVMRRAVVLPAEEYDDERIAEFRKSAELSDSQVSEVRAKWGL